MANTKLLHAQMSFCSQGGTNKMKNDLGLVFFLTNKGLCIKLYVIRHLC